MWCTYYQADVNKAKTWFFVAALRSYEHIAFDRTIDTQKSIFEFFVPPDLEADFLTIMHKLEKKGLVSNLTKLKNRLQY